MSENDWTSYPGENWPRAQTAGAGLNLAAGALLARPQSNARAWLVVQHGQLVTEDYFQGSAPSDRHHLFSITKSVLSLLVGMALPDSLEQPVLDFFPEFSPLPANPWRLLTLRHLLSMTCGMVWPGGGKGREPMLERLRHSPNWGKFILDLPVRRAEIGQFHYNSAASHLLALILQRATGQTACDYARERLFAPLGIDPVNNGTDWETDPTGSSIGGWGLHLSASELARIGWLALCDGFWRGQSLVPQTWLAASTGLPVGQMAAYGYHWWLRRVGNEPVFAAIGFGGQYMFCVPQRQLLAVILSQPSLHWPDRWEVLKALLA